MTDKPFRIEVDTKLPDKYGDKKFKTEELDIQSFYIKNSCFPSFNTAVFEMSAPRTDIPKYFYDGNETIRVYFDDILQWSGIVTNLERQFNLDSGATMAVGCRDISFLLMTTCPPPMKIAGKTIVQLAEKLIEPFVPYFIQGVISDNSPTNLKVVNSKRKIVKDKYKTEDYIYNPETGYYKKIWKYKDKVIPARKYTKKSKALDYKLKDKYVDRTKSIWQILMEYCKKLGVTMWITPYNELFIGRPDYSTIYTDGNAIKNKASTYSFSTSKSSSNNIISAKFVFKTSELFDEYIALGQGRTNRKTKGRSLNKQSHTIKLNSERFIYSPNIRVPKRKITKINSRGVDKYTLRRMNRSEVEEDFIKAFEYTMNVEGYKNKEGLIYNPDNLVDLTDNLNFINNNDDFYLSSRTINVNMSTGITTTIEIMPSKIWLYADDTTNDDEYISNLGILDNLFYNPNTEFAHLESAKREMSANDWNKFMNR